MKRALSVGEIDVAMSYVAESARSRYKSGWADWSGFRDGVEIPQRLDPSVKNWGSPLLGFSAWRYKISGVGFPGLLASCSSIMPFHLIGGCGVGNSPFRARIIPGDTKRANQAKKKKTPAWIWPDFSDISLLRDLQSRDAMVIDVVLSPSDFRDRRLGGAAAVVGPRCSFPSYPFCIRTDDQNP